MSTEPNVSSGGCTCGSLRYQVTAQPMIVHACHCRGCQQNSGSSFAVNALFEFDRVLVTSGQIEEITVPTPSGTGQDIVRCAACKVAIWSNYNMGGKMRKYIRFIRVGTLDDPDQMPPDVHIYTLFKQPWVILPEHDLKADLFYDTNETWSSESLMRLAELKKAAGVAAS